MNYKKLITDLAVNQGYSLGLETYHRLKMNNSRAAHYAKIAQDFNRFALKVKTRALKHGVNRVQLSYWFYDGLKQGKMEASQNVSK